MFHISLGLAASIAKMEKLKCYHWHDTGGGGGKKCLETNKVAVGTQGLVFITWLKPTRRLSKLQITQYPS